MLYVPHCMFLKSCFELCVVLQSFSLIYETQANCECFSVLNFTRIEPQEWSCTSSKLRLNSTLDSQKCQVSSIKC